MQALLGFHNESRWVRYARKSIIHLDLEQHGGRTITGVAVRVLQRVLALTAAIWHTAVNHFLTHGRGGSIVNVSSHQAQRPVRGHCPTRPRRRPSRV